jgi:glycosyltransferase involved in cell wall biosynthesis
MRVLHVNGGNIYGGVEALLVTLARCRQLCRTMEPSFAVCFDGRLSRELISSGVPVHMLGDVRTRRIWTVLRARKRLRELLKKGSFDAVICHMSWAHSLFGPVIKRARLPLIFWAHGPATGRPWVERLARRTKPDAAVCNSSYTATSINSLFEGVPRHIVYCPVAAEKVSSSTRKKVREDLALAEDAVVILQVSRMEAWKGHALHLRALAEMRDEPNWVCLMVGGAQRPPEVEYFRRLQQLADELGLRDRVRFLGRRSDVRNLMGASDIFCQPNQSAEPFGIVFIEAMLAGLPVITTALGGALEIVTESSGVLVPPDNPYLLAEHLRILVQSPARRRKLSEGGPARAHALSDPATQLCHLHEVLANLN